MASPLLKAKVRLLRSSAERGADKCFVLNDRWLRVEGIVMFYLLNRNTETPML